MLRSAALALIGLAAVVQPLSAQDPALVGEWSEPMDWPVVGVHAAVLHTGKVIHFSYPLDLQTDGGVSGSVPHEHHHDLTYRLWLYGDEPAAAPREERHAGFAEEGMPTVEASNAWVHDLETWEGTLLDAPNNAFCAGHTFLADGRLLIVGGTEDASLFGYVKRSYLFDPLTESYTMSGDMQEVRWYPTAMMDVDGTVLTVSGLDRFPEVVITDVVERYVPDVGWSVMAGAEKLRDLYPHMMMLPDGRFVNAGPDPDTYFFDPKTGEWEYIGDMRYGIRYQANAVLLPPGNDKILCFGGSSQVGLSPAPSTKSVELLDTTAADPKWVLVESMNYRRSFSVPVLLPDGKLLVVGGRVTSNSRSGCPGIGGEILPAEMYDPATGHWTEVASLHRPRLYHSTAVLIPDGRVLATGGDCEYTAELYSPPYLFTGTPRPTIVSAPTEVHHGEDVVVQFADVPSIARVALIRPPAVTHANAMDQRLVETEFTETGPGEITLHLSPNPAFAPAGWYMLFLLDDLGVPSVAEWVHINIPPATPLFDGAPESISLSSGGVQEFDLSAGPQLAGEFYWVTGSASGTAPGISSGGVTLPLNLDAYFLFTLQYPNTIVQSSLGLLSGAGLGTAELALPPGASPGLAGVTLHHAYMLLDPLTLTPTGVSNPIAIELSL